MNPGDFWPALRACRQSRLQQSKDKPLGKSRGADCQEQMCTEEGHAKCCKSTEGPWALHQPCRQHLPRLQKRRLGG